MAHGGYGNRRVAERKHHVGRRSKGLGVDKKPKPKPKAVSLKNQIRSTERMLRKELPPEVREAQEKKLEGLKKQQEIHTRLALERKIFLRDRKIKFFERRKIERGIRRLEKLQRGSSGQPQDAEIAEQLSKLKEDLEYVRFFPKTEKYVSLFTGGEDSDMVDRRNRLRKQIKANLIAAAASGKDMEETGSEDDGLLDLSEDDFFLTGTSSDEANADDEWTDKSTREQASSTSGKAASGMSSDERNQRQMSARALMPPPRPSNNSRSNSVHTRSRFGASSSKKPWMQRSEISTSSNTSSSISGSSFKAGESSNTRTGHSSNLSSNSDARKPRRKRRPKKKKQQA
ncbi:rRNA-processing protein EFG1 isoform X1 [Ricinus communis]|uniref:rRNA-processing protein EFG1 isoform X1 n=1 Tax=Ricinus communis TaxID=3988 RepID=UPI00077295B7|nr:rRNA-processing protein EFG1 isoform X1 [Ricinus communis]|eukprot:XP_015573505.1 rRNA-processing protein EFG1 isoform X1 [Ricinus communis]